MGALLGARGGVDIPDKDRKRTFNHLKSHYLEFEKDVPEFKGYEEAELKEVFPELFEEKSEVATTAVARYCQVIDGKETFVDVPLKSIDATHWELDDSEVPENWTTRQFITTTGGEAQQTLTLACFEDKAGAVLSKGNKTKLRNAVTAINEVLASADPVVEDEEKPKGVKQKSPDEDEEKVDLKELVNQVAVLAEAVQALTAKGEQEVVEPVQEPVDETPTDDIDLDSIEVEEEKDSGAINLDLIDEEKFSEQLDSLLTSKVSTIVSEEFNRATGKLS
jgi:hypothetical protein